MAKSEVETVTVEEEPARTRASSLTRLARAALQTGTSLALLPIALLPEASQKHMRRAGSEFALGLAELLRATSETIDKTAAKTK
jgi:hypothetical protein